jgi:hypothetical protein
LTLSKINTQQKDGAQDNIFLNQKIGSFFCTGNKTEKYFSLKGCAMNGPDTVMTLPYKWVLH